MEKQEQRRVGLIAFLIPFRPPRFLSLKRCSPCSSDPEVHSVRGLLIYLMLQSIRRKRHSMIDATSTSVTNHGFVVLSTSKYIFPYDISVVFTIVIEANLFLFLPSMMQWKRVRPSRLLVSLFGNVVMPVTRHFVLLFALHVDCMPDTYFQGKLSHSFCRNTPKKMGAEWI